MPIYSKPSNPGRLLWHKPPGLPFVTRYPSISGTTETPKVGDILEILRGAFGGVVATNETLKMDGVDVMSSAVDNADGTYSLTAGSSGILEYAAIPEYGPRRRSLLTVEPS